MDGQSQHTRQTRCAFFFFDWCPGSCATRLCFGKVNGFVASSELRSPVTCIPPCPWFRSCCDECAEQTQRRAKRHVCIRVSWIRRVDVHSTPISVHIYICGETTPIPFKGQINKVSNPDSWIQWHPAPPRNIEIRDEESRVVIKITHGFENWAIGLLI